MNILFVYSRQDYLTRVKPLENPEQIQFGISYISAFLKKHGHSTKLLILTKETPRKIIDKYLNEFSPSLVCFTAVFSEYAFVSKIAQYIKETYPHIYLLCGGPHVSLNPECCLKESFDALCIGEGEYPTLELAQYLEQGRIPVGIANLWIKCDGKVEKNSPRPFIKDIDSLPFPDREMWQEWIMEPGSCCSVLASRGCPFQCTYCCNHALKKITSGQYVRFRSPGNIVQEIKEIVSCYPTIREFFFEAETIVLNKNFAVELALALESFNNTLDRPLSFGAIMRIVPNVEVDNIFAAFKKSNFRFINIGLESGSERVRSQILKRDYSNEDVLRVSALARKYGLKVCFYNLIGIPTETAEDIRATININRRCLPDWHFLSIFFPYPGTDLYLLCQEKGLIKGCLDTELERHKVVLGFPEKVKKRIMKSYIWFDYYVYKGYKPLYKILARVIVSKLKTQYLANLIYRKLISHNLFAKLRNLLRS